jgi:hypothetical protein
MQKTLLTLDPDRHIPERLSVPRDSMVLPDFTCDEKRRKHTFNSNCNNKVFGEHGWGNLILFRDQLSSPPQLTRSKLLTDRCMLPMQHYTASVNKVIQGNLKISVFYPSHVSFWIVWQCLRATRTLLIAFALRSVPAHLSTEQSTGNSGSTQRYPLSTLTSPESLCLGCCVRFFLNCPWVNVPRLIVASAWV